MQMYVCMYMDIGETSEKGQTETPGQGDIVTTEEEDT